ncbi:MAG: hypothetical protein GY813_09385 [Halieaceae bacterium]|nr:hypothetical protein [Halieaceae bacterium]
MNKLLNIFVILFFLSACSGPLPLGKYEALLFQQPLCLLACNAQLDNVGQTEVTGAESFTGGSVTQSNGAQSNEVSK